MTHESGTLPAEERADDVRPDRSCLRRDEPADDCQLDQRWRRLTVRTVVSPGDRVLDACCGAGDLAVAARKAGAAEVVGLDFERMLERARRRTASIEWIRGDLLELPFEDASFDAATVGFGVRNVSDLEWSLAELRRVLRPGGRLGILEITQPRGLRPPGSGSTCSSRWRARSSRWQCVYVPARERSPAFPARTSSPTSCVRGGSRT